MPDSVTTDLTAFTAEALQRVRDTSPLVQCLTNSVVTNFTANVLLAAGVAPAMVDIVGEAGPFAGVGLGRADQPGHPGLRSARRHARGGRGRRRGGYAVGARPGGRRLAAGPYGAGRAAGGAAAHRGPGQRVGDHRRGRARWWRPGRGRDRGGRGRRRRGDRPGRAHRGSGRGVRPGGPGGRRRPRGPGGQRRPAAHQGDRGWLRARGRDGRIRARAPTTGWPARLPPWRSTPSPPSWPRRRARARAPSRCRSWTRWPR